jgi:protein-S-isoprenylcysteine O-methyltransferase
MDIHDGRDGRTTTSISTPFANTVLFRQGQESAQIAVTAAILGGIFFVSVMASLWKVSEYRQLTLYFAALAFFHFLEFYVTAKYNPAKLSMDSFLLNNGRSYALSHAFAIVEASVEQWLWPGLSQYHIVSTVGIVLVIVGQLFRTLAMIHAASNFSHVIQRQKRREHQLVTNGVYGFSRHPSYFGFFYWAIGLQLFMVNPVSFIIFSGVLWRFFYFRIIDEETHLVEFFGEKYQSYRKATSTKIPFIP